MVRKNNKLNESLNLIAKSSLITMVGIFLSKILTYAYRIIIARYYGPEVYGLFSLATVILGWFTAIAALGLSDGLVRYIPYYRGKGQINKIRYLLRKALFISAIVSVLAGIVLFFTSSFLAVGIFHNQSLVIYLQIFSILVPISILANPLLAVLRSYEKINLYSFTLNVSQNLGKVVFLLLLVIIGIKNNAVPISYLLGITLMLLISYILCKRYLPSIFIRPNLKENEKSKAINELFHYSLPLMFYSIGASIFTWIDSISIGYYKTAVEVGIYNAAVPIAALISIVPELFMQLFFPLINKEYGRKNLKLINQLSKQVAKWIFAINIPIFIIIAFFPGVALNVLFGSQYLGASTALILLSISALISSVFIISNQLISMVGKSRVILTDIVIAGVANFLLNMWLVPAPSILGINNSSGINGAALATLISVLLFNTILFIQGYMYTKVIPIRRKMINVILAIIIPVALAFYFRHIVRLSLFYLVIFGLVFVLIYALLLFAFHAFDKNDSDIMDKIKGKALQIARFGFGRQD